MSYFRSYFEKNNTIVKDSRVNTAKNPDTNIFYGSSFSKFIFKVDLEPLREKINNGDFVLTSGTTIHNLHLYNTIFGDTSFLGKDKNSGGVRTSSFDLVLFKISEDWDEGVGYEYVNTVYDLSLNGNNLFSKSPSNWYNRTTNDEWTTPGVILTSGSTEVIQTIHFDNGDENINVDISSVVNDILNGGNNYGFGISFDYPYETILTDVDQSVSFFTKYTQTFYEPFIESIFDDVIVDDRLNFIGGNLQYLYLYVTKGKNPYDLDVLPTVDILDSTKTLITGLTNLSPIKVKKGVYKIPVFIDKDINVCDGKRFYFDVWKGLTIDGTTINNITQKFVPQPYTSNYTIGAYESDTKRYVSQFSGIQQNEKIKRGEKRKISVKFKSINQLKQEVFSEVYYRIYITEGRTQVDVFNWTKLDVTTENSFILDTSYLIPREYTIEIKGITHGEELHHPNNINFEIVSER